MQVDDMIYIEASPEVVWKVTQDVERWPEWTPTVTSVRREDQGPLRLRSRVRIKQPLQPESTWVVTEFEPGRRFAWQTLRAGLHMTGTHELSARGFGTRNVLRVDVGGVGAALLWPLLRIAIRRALAQENLGLKARCEGASPLDAPPEL